MGASLALAGVTACTRQPTRRSSLTSGSPRRSIPGKPLYYATAMTLGGVGTGLLVESHEGRPDEDRGQPAASGQPGRHRRVRAGRDPRPVRSRSRARRVTNLGEIRPWPAFLAAMTRGARPRSSRSAAPGSRILTESISSPTLAAQIAGPAGAATRRPSGISGIPRAGRRACRRAGSRSASRGHAVPHVDGPTSSWRSMPTSSAVGPGIAALRARRSRRAGSLRQPDRMNRLYALESMPTADRLARRSPPRAAAERDRGVSPDVAAAVGVGGVDAAPAVARRSAAAAPIRRRRRQGPPGAPAARASSSPATSSRRRCTRSRTR